MIARSIIRTRTVAAVLVTTLGMAVVPAMHAYALMGSSWPTGNITMRLQLDATAPANVTLPLRDGSTTWNAVAQSAIDEWNPNLVRSKLVGSPSTSTVTSDGDNVNSVFFDTTVYGTAFDQYTLAITLVDQVVEGGWPSVRTAETDLVVNKTKTWNAYTGPLASDVDLRRVVLHELGHVLGLDHPDQQKPAQAVSAIMNSQISGLYYHLQSDDITGITYLYGSALPVSTITTQPTPQTVSVNGKTSLAIGVNGTNTGPAAQPAKLSYNWYFKAANATAFERLFTVNGPSMDFGTAQLADAGAYYVEIETPDGKVTSSTATLTVNPIATTTSTALHNISTRGIAGSGSSTMIVGFVVTGSRAKNILLRAVGPTLGSSPFNVPGTLTDPKLTLVGQGGATLATSIDVWDQASNASQLRDTFSRVGAFPLLAGSHDAVILTTVQPGNYTALATSASNASGVVLVEAYDADTVQDATSTLKNLSTRGYVGSGANVLIAGFSVQGPGPRTYLIRVSGPSLIPAPYNVTGTIPDPILTLFDNNSVQIRVNDDWDSPSSNQAALNTAFQQAGAFSWKYPSTANGVRDDTAMQSAMLVTLQPGNYTAQASGNSNNGSTESTGNALIEIYEMP